jgi:WD40 repeat protein
MAALLIFHYSTMTIFDSKILLSAGLEGKIRFTHLSSGTCLHIIDKIDGTSLNHINHLRTGKSFVAVSGNPWIRVYPLEQLNKSPVVYRGHSGNVVSTDFQQDEKWFISCCEDGFIRVWDLRCTGYQSSQKHQSPINCAQLLDNQVLYAFGDMAGQLNIYDLRAAQIASLDINHGSGNAPGLGVTSLSVIGSEKVIVAHNNIKVAFVGGFEQTDTEGQHILKSTIDAEYYDLGLDLHIGSFVTSVSSSSFGSRSICVSTSDGSVSVWRHQESNNWNFDSSLDDSLAPSTTKPWCFASMFLDKDDRFLLAAFSDGVTKLWDTIRPGSGPIASYECGNNVQSIALVETNVIDLIDRRLK